MNSNLALLQTLQESMLLASAAGKESYEVGHFRFFTSAASDAPWLNFAIPFSNLVTEEDVETLVRSYRSRGRAPRVEMIQTLFPELSGLLESKGFELQMRMPVMLCPREEFQPSTSQVLIEHLTAEDDPTDYMTVGDAAFESPREINGWRIERWKEMVATGNFLCAQARVNGQVVGSGCIMPHGLAAELAGIGTLPEFRKRGIAGAVSSALMAKLWMERGPDWLIWLSASDDGSRSVYAKLGFRDVGVQENWILLS